MKMNNYENITIETIKWAYKPFDVVTNSNGDVGFIQEVSVNDDQDEKVHQISYAVRWLVGDEYKSAWFSHGELTAHCNLFVAIAECSCHPSGGSSSSVRLLMNNMENKPNE